MGMVTALLTVFAVPPNSSSKWMFPPALIHSRYPSEASDFLTRCLRSVADHLTQQLMVSSSPARSNASLSGTLTTSFTPSKKRLPPPSILHVGALFVSPPPRIPLLGRGGVM